MQRVSFVSAIHSRIFSHEKTPSYLAYNEGIQTHIYTHRSFLFATASYVFVLVGVTA